LLVVGLRARPVVIVRDDRFDVTSSVTVCALVTVSCSSRPGEADTGIRESSRVDCPMRSPIF
jgi:mRNA-degrading endonuclease toxin of MazEF toxin-antitoxin module